MLSLTNPVFETWAHRYNAETQKIQGPGETEGLSSITFLRSTQDSIADARGSESKDTSRGSSSQCSPVELPMHHQSQMQW